MSDARTYHAGRRAEGRVDPALPDYAGLSPAPIDAPHTPHQVSTPDTPGQLSPDSQRGDCQRGSCHVAIYRLTVFRGNRGPTCKPVDAWRIKEVPQIIVT